VELIGRGGPRAELERLLEPYGPARALVVTGEAGIGKTEVWRAGVEAAREGGWQVLVATPAEAEAKFSFAALGDLLAGTLDEALTALPLPQRRALEVALLLREPDGAGLDQHAVALAVLGALRSIASAQRLLLAIDDVQWLDAPSASLLGFALRRLEDEPVRALLTVRSGHLWPDALQLRPDRVARVELGPLTLGAIHRMLGMQLGEPLQRALLRRIHERANGNPLHALELARALERGESVAAAPDAFVAPRDLAELVSQRLRDLDPSARRTLLHLAASPRPSLDVARAATPESAEQDLSAAADAGLVRIEGRRVRFVHPLFASACYEAASIAERRVAHERLAGISADAEERARHLALAAEGPSAAVAEALDEGAREARSYGAPDAAAELTELARRLTPADDGAGRRRRALTLARYLLEAGEPGRARRGLEELIDAEPPGPERATALLQLSAILSEQEGAPAAAEVARQALDEARGVPGVEAEAHLVIAERAEAPIETRLDHLGRALEILDRDRGGNGRLLARALRERALADYHRGLGLPREPLERAAALEDRLREPPPVAWRARTIFGECLKYVDGFAEAETILAAAERQAESEGDVGSLPEILGHRAELALWLGRFEEADGLATRALDLARETGQGGRLAVASMFASLVAAHRADVDAARATAATSLAATREAGDRWSEALARSALGFLELSTGDPVAAIAEFEPVDTFASAQALTEPRQWRYLPDYVEALVAAGDTARARSRLNRLERWAQDAGTHWPAALAARARGLVAESEGDREGALEAHAAALAHHEALPLPFDRARTLLALGAAQRRARRKREARSSLQEAAEVLERLGAPLWAARAREELGRISGRGPAGGTLTASERRVAELVAQGRKNREIAAELVVTPRTVEAHLTRIYAKLGVRSRAELVRRLASSV
jgi:DNA-binding NarL/FixJ family response regulator